MRRKTLAALTVLIAWLSPAANAKNPFPRPHASGALVFRDLTSFNEAAGLPPVAISFDERKVGENLDGQRFCGVSFRQVNAPLIVVRGDETFTPSDFKDVSNPQTFSLKATSGSQLLSPGGTRLAPGPDPAAEDDDIIMIFEPPVAAVGFDHISQCADGNSFTHVQVVDVNGNEIFSGMIEIGPVYEQMGSRIIHTFESSEYSTTDFWGVVSSSANIKEVRIDERDDDAINADSNIGVDTLRVAPSRCGTSGDLNADGRVDSADIALLFAQWGDYTPQKGEAIHWSPADFDRNGTVNGSDLAEMMAHLN